MALKPRNDSRLAALPANQQEALERWLFEENMGYKEAAARVYADFNVKISTTALGEWYQRRAQQRMLQRIAASRSTANEVVATLKQNPAEMYDALLGMAAQIAFDKAMATGGQLDAETIYNFTKLVMAGKKQAMEQDRLNLARETFEFEAVKAVREHLKELNSIDNRGDLDDDGKMEQFRLRLFGKGPKTT